jgi:hypothetical protein
MFTFFLVLDDETFLLPIQHMMHTSSCRIVEHRLTFCTRAEQTHANSQQEGENETHVREEHRHMVNAVKSVMMVSIPGSGEQPDDFLSCSFLSCSCTASF